uniref:BRO family protein n=1 Tax=Dialister hominis TaxID=2582419 RepID=UPI0040251F77
MNEMIFKNPEFGQIRTVVIDSDAWFVGKDVALVLGYADVNKAIAMHVDDEDKRLNDKTSPSFGQRGATLINESGLYSLILSSKLPNAKKFKRWVTSEVLPAIRKTGGYIPHDEEMSDAEIMAKAFQISQRTIEEQHRKIGALEIEKSHLQVENQVMAPKADYFDELVDRNLLTNFRDTAKQLGIEPKKFVTLLLEKKYIFRDQKGKLMPYQDKNKGLFEVKECFNQKTKWAGVQTMVTPKGRETFRLLFE